MGAPEKERAQRIEDIILIFQLSGSLISLDASSEQSRGFENLNRGFTTSTELCHFGVIVFSVFGLGSFYASSLHGEDYPELK